MPEERFISATAVAARLGIKPKTLAAWRRHGVGPKGHFHLNGTRVVYPASAVEAFLASRQAAAPAPLHGVAERWAENGAKP